MYFKLLHSAPVASLPQIWNQNRAQLPPSFGLRFSPNFWLKFYSSFWAFSPLERESFVKGADWEIGGSKNRGGSFVKGVDWKILGEVKK